MNPNNINLREETLRASLYQFIGTVLNSYTDPEQAIAIVLEELTKVVATDETLTDFNNNLIKPIFKTIVFIMKTRYNKLKEDATQTFKDIPSYVQTELDNNLNLINSLESYINKL